MIAILSSILLATAQPPENEPGEEARVLEPIKVSARRVANLQPASTYAAAATALRFDPQVNLQARGLPEGQADITIRGGLFENTGFKIGAVTVFDPQTGHYAVEIPLDPKQLSSPDVLTDFDNSLSSFNSTVATVNYGFNAIRKGGGLFAGFGSDSLRFATLRVSHVDELDNGRKLGAALSAAASAGDGTLPYGDHDFRRLSGHLQLVGEHSESNLLAGYHDKFFGWPGAYTGFASLPETDHTKLGVLVLDHRWWDDGGWWEVGAAYRQLDDDYDFDRRTVDTGGPGSFEHKTRSFALGLAGEQRFAGLDWYISGQFSGDRLVRSTDLTNGFFNSRSYLNFSIAPGKVWSLDSGASLGLRAGLRLDVSNRDEDALMPMLRLALEQRAGDGNNQYTLDYSRTSQLPGYTALNSPPRGLFGGNPYLGREYADTLTLGFIHERATWTASMALFHRRDDDLVDWTYLQGAPFARQANAVDLEVTGFEGFISWRSASLELTGGYSWLDKDADYGSAAVDASYYALNYARHRFTLAVVYRPTGRLEFRMDNEYRRQQENPLRTGKDHAYMASLSAAWYPDWTPRMSFRLIADNLTDSDYQEFPGTPPMGRQVSLGLGLDW